MLDILKDVYLNLDALILNATEEKQIKTMFIDYHKPYVSRIWFPYQEYRIFLHKIQPCKSNIEALYHPHKWDSAMLILDGSYEMGIGRSNNNDIPKTDCHLILPKGTMYEMTEKDSWHYVNPINGPCYTLMVTGKLNGRNMPLEPNKEFRNLNVEEIEDILKHSIFNSDIQYIIKNLKYIES